MSTISAGRLSALSGMYAVDGKVSWHAPEVRGFAPSNCYLLTEGDRALLIDTGLTVHEDLLVRQLHRHLHDGQRLELMVLRQGEFDSMCNLLSIANEFEVSVNYGQFDDVAGWARFRSAQDQLTQARGLSNLEPTRVVRRRDSVELGEGRVLEMFQPSLRLLNTFWVYDDATRCLFTSDMFGHVIRETETGPLIVTSANDNSSYEDVRRHLLGTRYWWIAGADVDHLRRELSEVFDRLEIDTIAPAHGCILRGADVVKRHYRLVDEVLGRNGVAS